MRRIEFHVIESEIFIHPRGECFFMLLPKSFANESHRPTLGRMLRANSHNGQFPKLLIR